MLTWLAAGLSVAAVYAAVRRRRYVAAMLVLAAAGVATPVVQHVRLQQRLSGVATVLAGRDVTVHCQTFGESFVDITSELGYVKFHPDGTPENHTLIKREQCNLLRAYSGGGHRHPSDDEVIAVHVLVHESMHLRGLTSESEAECAAMQRDMTAARLLGATREQGRLLAQRYWQRFYRTLADDYRSAECRAGGTLDEHLLNPPWAS